MALFFYFAVILVTIQTAYSSSSIDSQRSAHFPLSLRRSAGSSRLNRRAGVAAEGIKINEGFWFADFSVGETSNLSLLIDTGSGDLVLNPGVYASSKTSRNLNTTFENTYGTTSSNGTGNGLVTGELYTDQVSFGSLTANQVIGSTTGDSPIPASGIVGFSGQLFSQFPSSTNATPFFQTLCNQNVVTECRFGLALTNSGSGTLTLGELDTTLYIGDLVVAPILEAWVLTGDLAIDGKIVANDLLIELDSGTATVVGPIDAVTSIFNATGIQAVLQSSSGGDVLTGYFPCDKPPTVGFSFPSQTNVSLASNDSASSVSKKSTVFNIPSSAWIAVNNGDNNCTAILSGQNYATAPGLWVVGQPFFQELYLDHNLENATVGFAPLKTQASASPTSSTSVKPTQSASGAGGIPSPSWPFLGRLILLAYLCVSSL